MNPVSVIDPVWTLRVEHRRLWTATTLVPMVEHESFFHVNSSASQRNKQELLFIFHIIETWIFRPIFMKLCNTSRRAPWTEELTKSNTYRVLGALPSAKLWTRGPAPESARTPCTIETCGSQHSYQSLEILIIHRCPSLVYLLHRIYYPDYQTEAIQSSPLFDLR